MPQPCSRLLGPGITLIVAVEPSSGDIVRDISDSDEFPLSDEVPLSDEFSLSDEVSLSDEAGSLSKTASRSFTSFLADSVSSDPSEGHETRGATVPSAIRRTRTALNLAWLPTRFTNSYDSRSCSHL